MSCYKPLRAYYTGARTERGKRVITFNSIRALNYRDPIQLPCGQCIGCRLERSRQWAIRCVHEAQLHEFNCFITLTYNDDNLPERGLVKADFQKFMKRFRKRFTGLKIRYYMCGEYGENFGRPHFHACIFGFDFPDKKIWREERGVKLYRSEELEKLWKFGYSSVGAVTFESAAYVARYIMKKINGERAQDHYERVDYDTGEVYQIQSEYTTMSRRPGVAADWFKKFNKDVYPHDQVILRNKKMRPPRYYDALYEIQDKEAFEAMKKKRVKKAKLNLDNNTLDRLECREQVQLLRLKQLPRKLS